MMIEKEPGVRIYGGNQREIKHNKPVYRTVDPQINIKPAPVETRLGKCEREILAVIHYHHIIAGNENRIGTSYIAVSSGYAIGSGSFNNSMSRLRSLGLITGSGENISITEEGLKWCRDNSIRITLFGEGAVINYWKGEGGKCCSMILDQLEQKAPGTLSAEEICGATGYSAGSGSFNNALSWLRSKCLIEGTRNTLSLSKELMYHTYPTDGY